MSAAYTPSLQRDIPHLARVAEEQVRAGTPRAEAIDRVAAETGARVDDLRAAKTWWLRRMPQFRWNDYTGVHVLAVLEEALARVDPLVPGRTGD
jgi:hypothetical protein